MAEDRMRNGYKQNTREWGKYLRYSKPLDRVMRYVAVQHSWYFRRSLPRSKGPGPHSADMVRVEKRIPGGYKKDRMEYRVVAYSQKNYRNATKTLKKSLVHVSEGRTITRGGKVSEG